MGAEESGDTADHEKARVLRIVTEQGFQHDVVDEQQALS